MRPARRRAFTLLEAAVVLVLLGVVAALAVGTFRSFTEQATDARNEFSLGEFVSRAHAAAVFRAGPSAVFTLADAQVAAESMDASPQWQVVTEAVPTDDPLWGAYSPGYAVVHVAVSADGSQLGAAMVSRPSASCVFAYRDASSSSSWTVPEDLQGACSAVSALSGDRSPPPMDPALLAPPASPTLVADTVSQSAITVSAAPVANASGYRLRLDGVLVVDAGTLAYTASGLDSLTTYTFTAEAYNAYGVSPPVSLTVTTLPDPPASPAPSASALSTSSIELSWTAVSGADEYTVSLADGTLLATVSSPGFVHTGLAPATEYSYTVTARNAGGASAPASVSATTSTPVPVAPMLSGDCGALTGTSATGVCTVSWNAPEWATSYQVQTVGATDSGTYTTTNRSVSFQGGIGISIGNHNVVRVRACNAAGECSSLTDGGSFIMRAAPAPAVPTVSWACAAAFGVCQATVQAQWAQGYHVQSVYHSGNGVISCPGGCSDETGVWTTKSAPEGFYDFYMFGTETKTGGGAVTLTVGRPPSPIFGITGRIIVAGSNNAGDGFGHCIPPGLGLSPDPATCRYADVATSQ